jgi:hypothetical protein
MEMLLDFLLAIGLLSLLSILIAGFLYFRDWLRDELIE